MKRNSERGVALVITLIMLALVTSMAVVFLGVSRREKTSVSVTEDIVTARLMVDAARARAESEIAARMLSSTNPFDYDLIVSTNYYNPNGFQPGVVSPYNVNYERRAGQGGALQGNDWFRNIANLQYEARPPVFITTNQATAGKEFRFFLDLNRNGLFEPTGLLATRDLAGRVTTNLVVGDPQWVGVLEHPDLPHGENNQFVGRYTYVIVPIGKTLDINYAHNAAKRLRTDMSLDGFMRHQGVGSWEINLAGFFAGLNTNLWSYNFNPSPNSPSSGTAFDDARLILSHRYDGNMGRLASASALFNFQANPFNPFATNGIDYYSDGPTVSFVADAVNQPWSGSFNPNGYYDVQDLFSPGKISSQFVQRLLNFRTTNANQSAYDRYTYYRLLAQMGTDSKASESNKVYFADYQLHPTNRLHLNYVNFVPEGQTNFVPWSLNTFTRSSFFTNAADRLLRTSLELNVFTNGFRRETNFMMGVTGVRPTFCATDIQLYHINAGKGLGLPFYVTNNEYSSAVHRLLQVSANLQDATSVQTLGTAHDYPSVYRPVFMRTDTNLIICGFTNQVSTEFLNNWMTVEQAMGRQPPPPGLNAMATNRPYADRFLYGVPLVIGAKKGYPNFNKLVVQTVADVSRRLEIRKASMTSPPAVTNQMYVIGVSNRLGVEGWNSYRDTFNRNLEFRVTNQVAFALHHKREGSAVEYRPLTNYWVITNASTMSSWPGSATLASLNSFVVPIDTNITTLPSSIYLAQNGLFTNTAVNVFEKSFRVPQWYLRITNRLQYVVIDKSVNPPRIIDFVNVDKFVSEVDISRGLTGDTNAAGGGIFSDKNKGGGKGGVAALTEGDMWNPVHSPAANLDAPSMGVLNQIAVAKGNPYTGQGTWRSSSTEIGDKEAAIKQFTAFLEGQITNLTWQVPFTPSRRLYQRTSWEANDPLVHYTLEDLSDFPTTGTTNLQARPIDFAYDITKDAMLRQVNPRYRPWGGNPNKDASNDPTAYALTLKDPLVRRSDDWQFPSNKLANLGGLGSIHRGTPWQTIYLKAGIDPRTRQPLDFRTWANWSGSVGTHPTNDWRLIDLFTVAPNENAGRGLLSVNQTNMAAWSAVLSGLTVLTNSSSDAAVGPSRAPQFSQMVVQPNTPQLESIVAGVNRVHAQQPNRSYRTMGEVLAVPELTVFSPYLNQSPRQTQFGLDDAAYERIPREALSLLKTDESRIAVYAFGQALKPAERSLVTAAGFFNLCTNYQITGEFASKTVLRLEDLPNQVTSRKDGLNATAFQKVRAVVESYSVLQPD